MEFVALPEIPREPAIHLPAGVSALVVVHMQNDLAHPAEGTRYGPDERLIGGGRCSRWSQDAAAVYFFRRRALTLFSFGRYCIPKYKV